MATKKANNASQSKIPVSAKIDRMIEREDATVKAYASVNIGGAFVIKDIAVVDGQKGMFARMPFRSYKTGSGETKYSDITMGFRNSATALNDKTYPMSGYSGTMTEQYTRNKYLKAYYDGILSDMATHYTRPSFTAYTASAAKTFEMDYSGGRYTVTLTDTNRVLQNYAVTVSGGASVSVNGNISRLLFKMAVELAVTMNVVAASSDIDDITLERLKGECVKEVKRLNGNFTFRDANDWQKG